MTETRELSKIIQKGIAAGRMQKAKGSTGFTPFTLEILLFSLPYRFKYSLIKGYDETTDPINHLNIYTDVMNLQVVSDQVMCKSFS